MRAKRFSFYAVALFAVFSLATGALAAGVHARRDFTEGPRGDNSKTGYAVVVLKDAPAASYSGGIPGLKRTKPARGKKLDVNSPAVKAYVSYLGKGHANYRAYLKNNAPKAKVVSEYVYTANGFAIQLNGASKGALGKGPGVKYVADSGTYLPAMNVSTGLIRADELWPMAGGRENAGAGIKVGIIDTGIDDTQPFFACKDADGDGHADIPHKVYASGQSGDPSNILVFDHGTHVSGTVAGCVINLSDGPITGPISGVAPAAELWDYNVFPGFGGGFIAFGGSAFSHDIIRALEDTVRDGMDVANMSLGGQVQGPHDTLAEAVNATVDAGIVVAVAAGNSGPGDSTVESPGSAANAFTAGASTNPHFIGIPVTSGGNTFGAAVGDFNSFDPPITADYTVTDPANGCSAISTDLVGKLALIDRGVCTFTTKVRNAQDAGAVGVLVVNNVAGDPTAMAHDGTDPFPTIPAAMLSKNDGNSLKPSGTATVDGTSETEFITSNADILAGFSSRGPTPFTYLIKPDVTAPGVNVYSSVFNGEFAMFQGTSMATPHLAGSSALLLQLHPRWAPADVKSALVNTAARVVTDSATGTMDPGVLARGGGRIDLVTANDTPLTLDPVSASFGFWNGNKPVSGSVVVSVLNVSGGDQSCSVSVTGPSFVTASPSSFNLASGESTSITLTIDAGTEQETGSGDYDGDAIVDCGESVLQAPWWARISRNGKP